MVVSVGESDEWRFESKLGQSVRLSVDAASAVNIGLTDNVINDDMSLLVHAVAALVSTDHSTSTVHSCTQLKVSGQRFIHTAACRHVEHHNFCEGRQGNFLGQRVNLGTAAPSGPMATCLTLSASQRYSTHHSVSYLMTQLTCTQSNLCIVYVQRLLSAMDHS